MNKNQVTDFVDIDINFEYTGVNYDSPEEFLLNILEFEAYFESMDWTKEELEYIAEQLVETGRIFAKNQGLGPGDTRVSPDGRFRPGNSGTLYYGIQARPNGNQVSFWNDAINSRGQPYAGHIEYGFHDREGKFVPARPFMRPAFYAVAEASKGNFQQIMKGMLENIWTSQGYMGITGVMGKDMKFGMSKNSQSLFWKRNGDFGRKLSEKSRMPELRGAQHRRGMSLTRDIKRGKGNKYYRSTANRKDFGLLKSGKRMNAQSRQSLRAYERDSKTTQRRSSSAEKQKTRQNRIEAKSQAGKKTLVKTGSTGFQGKHGVKKKQIDDFAPLMSKEAYIKEYTKIGVPKRVAAERYDELYGGR